MTEKEKAKELLNKFKYIKIIFIETESGKTQEASITVTDELAKQCAIIAVQEIISELEENYPYSIIENGIDKWKKIETEITKL